MVNQSVDQVQDARITKTELLARIEASHANLEKTLAGLNKQQLSTPGPEEWAVKDHLVHLSVWELGIAALLQHEDRLVAMNVDGDAFRTKSEDEINDIIFRKYAHLSWDDVVPKYQEAHRRLLKALDTLSDDDLYRPYAYFVAGDESAPQGPVIHWITGNTYGHYDQHNVWIKSLVEAIH